MSTDQLKPCPFCGSAATLEDDRLLWVVRCTGCGTCVLGERAEEPEHDLPASYWEPFRQSAIDRWNRRAALAQPGALGPTDEEMNDTYWKAWHEHLDRTNSVLHAAGLRAVLARYSRSAIAPIPVSERLPGAEDCAPEGSDAVGCCWLWEPDINGHDPLGAWKLEHRDWASDGDATHWLPFQALPFPSENILNPTTTDTP